MKSRIRFPFPIALLLLFVVMADVGSARGLFSSENVLIPKGKWIVGATLSYYGRCENNYRFLIFNGINGGGYQLGVSPMVVYFFRDNAGIGGRLQYERSMTQIDTAHISVNTDAQLDVNNIYSISHNYSCMGVMRHYIGCVNSMRLGLYNETRLKVGGGQSKLVNDQGNSLSGVYESKFVAGVQLSPGIVVFFNENWAIELNVGVFDVNYLYIRQQTDQVYEGTKHSFKVDMCIDLLSVGLGIIYCI